MSIQDDEPVAPAEPIKSEKPARKRTKAKKKVASKPKSAPRKKKPAKKKVKTTRKVISKKRKPAKARKSGKSKAGRPRKKNRPGIHNKLYRMMKAKLPKKYRNGGGEINFKLLIKELKMTPEGVYKWFRQDHVPPASAVKIVKLTKNRVKLTDLINFIV